MAPTVTVVVPAYNLARFLPAALDSALGQDWPAAALDVVVVDDGSTDDTPAVLERYAGRVRVVRQPNGGLVRAVDRGLADVRGEYVALLDATTPGRPTVCAATSRTSRSIRRPRSSTATCSSSTPPAP
jgi:glycosyltransferase involved in cell wall biosynthesis